MAKNRKSNKQHGRKSTVKPANNGLMNVKKVEDRYGGINASNLHISEGWHTVREDINDVQAYILNYLAEQSKYDVIKIWIGTDAMRRSIRKNVHEIRLMTTICLRRVGKGVHVIKRRESHIFERFVSTAEKLNMEVNKTYELAIWLRDLGFTFEVHLDLNTDPNHESFNVFKQIDGWFESMGFKTEYKPDAAGATCSADYFL